MERSKLHQKERAVFAKDFFKDLFINGIDGVVILFFVTTGLTSAGVTQYILLVTAISVMILIALIMGVSAFIAAKEERNHFFTLVNPNLQEAEDLKEQRLLENLGIDIEVQSLAQEEIDKDRKHWQNLMIQLGDDQNLTDKIKPYRNGLITAVSYIFGGMIPIIAYFFTSNTNQALQVAGILSLTTLFIFGYFKSRYLETPLIGGAMASLFSGALAGITGYFIAKLFIQIT